MTNNGCTTSNKNMVIHSHSHSISIYLTVYLSIYVCVYACENLLAKPQKEILSSQVCNTPNRFTVLYVLEKYLCIQTILCTEIIVKYGQVIYSLFVNSSLFAYNHMCTHRTISLHSLKFLCVRFQWPHIKSIIRWCGCPLSWDKKL